MNGNGTGVEDFNGKENVIFQKVPTLPLSMYSSETPSHTPELLTGSYPPPVPPAGGLNITNPRYSAMYRNTLLRYSPTESQQSCQGSPVRSVVSSPYHTFRSQQHQPHHQYQQHQQYQQQQQYIQVLSISNPVDV